MTRLLRWTLALTATLGAIAILYYPGLSGDFLFDDNPHIVRNELVQIDSVDPGSLWRAWNSSQHDFPHSRPLAMLTFGINHAFSGLSPFAFKATNLALHLLTGLLVFAVARRLGHLYLRFEGRQAAPDSVAGWAWLTATLWLLHPLNLSPVLLSVQRMTILSTLMVLLGVLFYLIGRARMSDGLRPGALWVWASPLFAGLGLLAKENALLLPLLLLVTEWTLFRFRGLDARAHRRLQAFFVVTVGVPALLVVAFLAVHPGYLSPSGRSFTMPERLLTETRVLWFYVRLLFSPDISAMGLFHDDFALSRGLAQPWTTLPAVAGWLATTLAALALRRRAPLVSFGVLFFLAGHALESTVIALEPVYEHRNYLPAIAPLFALAYLPTAGAQALPISRPVLGTVVAVVLASLAASTALRARDWSGFGRLIASEIENHPASLRANFQYGQILMDQIRNPALGDAAAQLAREHYRRVGQLNPDNVDGLFGLIALDLHLGERPPAALVDELAARLRVIPFGPLNVNINQFPFLVAWHDGGEAGTRLAKEQVLKLFEAALDNPTVPPIARATLYHSLRAYHHRVIGDPATALRYAELAIAQTPGTWDLHDRRVRLLAILGRWAEAEAALQEAVREDRYKLHREAARRLAASIDAARRGEPIAAAASDEGRPEHERRR